MLMTSGTGPVARFGRTLCPMFGLYPTGLFGELLQEHWAHPPLQLAFLVACMALFWPVLARSVTGRELPAIVRIVMIFAVMALHATFSVWPLSRAVPLGENFYSTLRLPFVPTYSPTNAKAPCSPGSWAKHP